MPSPSSISRAHVCLRLYLRGAARWLLPVHSTASPWHYRPCGHWASSPTSSSSTSYFWASRHRSCPSFTSAAYALSLLARAPTRRTRIAASSAPECRASARAAAGAFLLPPLGHGSGISGCDGRRVRAQHAFAASCTQRCCARTGSLAQVPWPHVALALCAGSCWPRPPRALPRWPRWRYTCGPRRPRL